MRLYLLILIALYACSEKKSRVLESNAFAVFWAYDYETRKGMLIEHRVNGIARLDKRPFHGMSAWRRGRVLFISKRVKYDQPGALILHPKNRGEIGKVEYLSWNDSLSMNQAVPLKRGAISFVIESMQKIGLRSIEVDHCGNTYFTIFCGTQYEYVIIEDSSCIDTKYSLTKLHDTIYTTPYCESPQ